MLRSGEHGALGPLHLRWPNSVTKAQPGCSMPFRLHPKHDMNFSRFPPCAHPLQGRIPWDPDTLRRAVRDIKAERSGSKAGGSNGSGSDDEEGGAERVSVLDCQDFARTELTQHEFFKG